MIVNDSQWFSILFYGYDNKRKSAKIMLDNFTTFCTIL